MHLSFKGFLILYILLVSGGVISFVILAIVGVLFQAMLLLLTTAFSFPIALIIMVIGGKVSEQFGIRFEKAKPEEIQREDDVLLQAVPFSSAILFFFVNMMMEEGTFKLLYGGIITLSAIAFYVLRAWAKIKDSPKYRYYSMNVFALLIGSMIGSFFTTAFMIFLPEEFSQVLTIALNFIPISIFFTFVNLAQTVFKKRYGYK